MRILAASLPLVLGASLAACSPPVAYRTTDDAHPDRGGTRTGRWSTKRLATKQAPSTLVAEDGSICLVSEERFRSVDARALVWCEWRRPPKP